MSDQKKMKCIGLLGGMSWESTSLYYQIINRAVQKKLGGLHSAWSVLYSVDFQIIEKMQQKNDWHGAFTTLNQAAQVLEQAGAEFLVMCTNTMHLIAGDIERSLNIPLLHIADATAAVLISEGMNTVGLLGTRFTMEKDFYKGRLKEKFGIGVITPPQEDRQIIHQIIYEELCRGIINDRSGKIVNEIISRLMNNGAEGVILGCTEIGMLVSQENSSARIFDTTQIHARAAAEMALAG